MKKQNIMRGKRPHCVVTFQHWKLTKHGITKPNVLFVFKVNIYNVKIKKSHIPIKIITKNREQKSV